MTRGGDFFDELIVERLELLMELPQLFGTVGTRRRFHFGMLADARRLDVCAELLVDAAGDELAAEDADRSGQRRRLRDDHLPGHRDVVPARRGQIRHRHDQRPIRPLVLRDDELTPDRVGGRRRSARAVDAQHDGAHRSVAARLADVLDQRVGAGDGAVHRIVAALAAVDGAGRIDDGDLFTFIEAKRLRLDVLVVGTLHY